MGPESEQEDDWGALQDTLANAHKENDDEPGINVVSNSGLSSGGAAATANSGELPYVTLLNAAVTMVKTGDLSLDEYVEGIKKLDVIADSALKVYAIPAVKKDLPGKLTQDQNAIMGALEVEIHRLKEGLALLLAYPQTKSSHDLETGHQTAVSALNAMANVQKEADAERARILEEEKQEKARRAQNAAGSEA